MKFMGLWMATFFALGAALAAEPRETSVGAGGAQVGGPAYGHVAGPGYSLSQKLSLRPSPWEGEGVNLIGTYSVESAVISGGGGIIADDSFGIVGQWVTGVAVSSSYTMDVGFVVPAVGCTEDAQCADGQLCTLDWCVGGACDLKPILYGDVNDDGFVNVGDTLCLLDSFAGNPNSAACFEDGTGPAVSFERKDIAPCPNPGDPQNMGEGFVNVIDILAALDVFAGIPQDPACDACNGSRPLR